MATYNWSALANGQTIDPFNPDADIINFDNPLISAADVVITGDTEAVTPYTTLSYGGKTVTFNTSPLALTATGSASHVNVTFANGSLLLIGDNTTGTANDEAGAAALAGGSGNDQIIGLGGADSLTGGGGNDLFTMYSDFGAWGDDTIRGDGGIDTINFNTGDAIAGITVTYVGFDGLGALGSITGGGGGNTITMSGVERVIGTHLSDSFAGTVTTPINGLNSDVTLVFEGAGGNDVFNGAAGDGRNTVISYRTAESGVSVNLVAGTAIDGLGGFDSFINIDGVFGSNFSDSITGGSNSRSISGGTFEFFEGFSGNDFINGGNGADRVQYTNSPGAVTVNLSTGIASDGWTGAFASNTLVNTNGQWGLSDTHPSNLHVNGDTFTATGADGSFVFSRVTNPASAIVGSWVITGGGEANMTAVLTFLSDGTYFMAEDGDSVAQPGGQDGMERGTYTWNSLTGAFTSNTTVDTNGDWGLSDGDVSNLQVSGDTLTATDSEGTFQFSRVIDDNPLVGGWLITDAGEASSTAVLTFLSNGTYFMAEDGDPVADPSGQDGMEFGFYFWNPLAGTDTLISIEQVRGSSFSDTLTGDANDNRLTGDGGNDTLDGGDGFDQAGYQFATNAISVNLATGTATDIGGTSSGTDSLIGIESVRGTDFADSLVGGGAGLIEQGAGDWSGVELFEGRAGNDTIDGGDTINGAGSIDVASYVTAPSGVIVNFGAGSVLGVATNTANDGYGVNGNTAGIDTLININGIEGSSFNDTLVGGDNDEFFIGRKGNDSIVGGGGIDAVDYDDAPIGVVITLGIGGNDGWGTVDNISGVENVYGSGFDDNITGDANANRLEGEDGNDTLIGGLGDDTLIGGDGNDWANYLGAGGSVTVNLASGTATGADGNDTLGGIEYVIGSNSSDTITGDDDSNFLRGNAGDDVLDGGGQGLALADGNIQGDFADYAGGAAVTVSLALQGAPQNTIGAGNDTLINFESIRGSSNADTLTGDDGNNFLRGGLGNDTLNGGAGTDWADYRNASGSVTVTLGNNDTTPGSSSGTDGVDVLNSMEGVQGSDFNDTLNGGAGNDWFRGRNGNDSINGGGGYDTVTYRGVGNSVTVNLISGTATGEGTDTLVSIEAVEGSMFFGDTLTGDNLPGVGNDIFGLGGSDLLRVTQGDDLLDGGADSDTIDFTQTGIVYSGATAVSVNLATGVADINRSAAGLDTTLVSIETVFGTAGDDSLVGGDAAHVPDSIGNAQSERFRGNGGNDTITGGDGTLFTYADYANSGGAVVANLFTGTASDGLGGTDTLVNIDGLRGGSGNDLLTGGSLSRTTNGTFFEILRGNAGNDTLDGSNANSGGNDSSSDRADYSNNTSAQAINVNLATGIVLDGLGGTDTLINIDQVYGGAGNDTLTGGAGNDVLDGGIGNDTLSGGAGSDQARFQQSTAGVIVNLSASSIDVNDTIVLAGTANDGMGGTDTLISMEGVRGSDFNDYIRGSDNVSTRQFLSGDAGNDTIDGGAGIDFASYSDVALVLGGLNAFIENGSGTVVDLKGGTDTLLNIEGLAGTNSNDTLTGGLGDQWFRGSGGSDSIDGGAGNDWVLYSSDPSGVTINLGAGTATDGYNGPGGLLALGGTDTLVSIENAEASDYNDSITGSSVANELRGRDGNDTLIGGAGNDLIIGGAGNDSLDGGADIDTADYAGASAGIAATMFNNTVANDGQGGADTISNIENIIGSGFNDTISGSSVANELLGRDGNDILSGGAGNDTIDGGAGDDFINYGAAASGVTVNLATGEVTSDGDGGTDSLSSIENIQDSAYGDDLTGSSVRNFIYLGAGNDTVDGAGDIDAVSYELAGAGVTINLFTDAATGSTIGTDVLTSIEAAHGSQYADIITLGNDGNNVGYVFGRAGDDSLTGGNDDDTFFGGSGNDTINGGTGIDRAGYMDDGGDAAGPITQGINANLATGSVVDGWGNTDTLTSIENLSGTHLADTLVGSNAGDVLSGESGNDSINGGDGNDIIAGGDGNDTLSGGLGIDTVWYVDDGAGSITQGINANLATGSVVDGWGNTDTLSSIEKLLGTYFGDTMIGGDGAYDLNGEAGNDSLVGGIGNDSLFGGDGNDTLDGGANIDQLRGDAGNDSISGGDGNDFITGGDGNDTLVGGAGTDTADYFFTDQSTGIDANLSTGIVTGGGGTDSLSSIEAINGTTLDDLITGNTNANTLIGNSGNDTLVGGDGSDTLSGGDGNDTLSGGDGSDILRVSSGADTLDGGADSDTIDFTAVTGVTYGGTTAVNVNLATGVADLNRSAAGTDTTLVSIETVLGTAGDDIFVGGDAAHNIDSFGNATGERFRGNGGNDTITGGSANGLNTTADYANNSSVQHVSANLFTGLATDGLGGTDTLVNVDRLHGGSGNDSLVGGSLSRSSTGNFQEFFRGNAGNDTMDSGNANSGGIGIDRADYANNTNAQAINVNLATGIVLDGLGGTDTLIDIIQVFGGAGNDTFLGGAGNDSFHGGAGNDTLDGAGGSDEVRFQDSTAGVIVNLSAGSIDVNGITVAAGTANDGMGGTDTLISMENVRGSDFNDHIRGSDNVSTRQFLQGDAGNDTIDGGAGIDFANYAGVALVLGGINALIENGSGTVNDKMGGTDTLLNIEGLAGTNSNDTLTGGLGDQWFRGNGGSDSIDGGAGNDWVLYSSDPSGVTINLGTGTATDGYNGSGGLLALGGTDTLVSIENAEGSDYNDSITGSSAANELRGRDGNDTLIGGSGNDTLLGGNGNDSMDGGADIDTADYAGASAGIAATMFNNTVANDGQGGADTISNIENLIGSAFNDSINGSATANRLDGGAGNDQIFAGGGNDTLIGGEGNDTLGGAAGNDSVDGGNGTDTADYSGAGVGISLALFSGVVSNDGQGGADTISNIENLNAGGFNDTISGSAVANRLDGGAGNDLIFAGAGDDTLVGGEGNDTLNGAAGNDSIDGGNGTDTADYTSAGVGISLALFSGVVANDGQGGADTISNIENLNAGGFNDTISGSAVANRLDGGAGNDLIFAGAGDDTLVGGEGNDTLNGAAGNDSVDGGNGTDTADYTSAGVGISLALFSGVVSNDGQSGADTILNIENLNAGGFNDTISGSSVANRLDGGAGNDLIFAGAGDDTLVGGEGNDTLNGAAGNDSIDGGNGIDTADYTSATAGLTLALFSGVVANDGQSGSDTISNIENLNAGGFNDTISGSSVANRLDGGAGNDLIFAGAGDDTLVGGEGNDTLNGAAGNDSIDGGNGIDTADYTSAGVGISLALFSGVVSNDGQGGADTISSIENLNAGGFNDTISGSSVANRLDGGAGNDLIFAGGGDDTLVGGEGNDTLNGAAGNDSIDGGNGIDTADYTSAGVGISLALFSGLATNDGQGGADTVLNIENVTGGGFNDTINGSGVANRLDGGAGNDSLFAGAGDDTLIGGANDDTLSGSSGNDQLTGGTGQDAFLFDAALGAGNIDTITDFVVVDDTIQLENGIFTGLVATGALAAGSFVSGAGAAAVDADDFIIYDTNTGFLSYDADGVGGAGAQQFATLNTLPAVTASDFLVV